MRQLRISKHPTDPHWPTDHAQALPLLRSLAAAHPLPLSTPETERLLRFIVAAATQYRGRGAEWAALLAAGYQAAVRCLAQATSEPDETAKYLGWRVRQGMLKALPLSVFKDGDGLAFST